MATLIPVIIALGSNSNAEKEIARAQISLKQLFRNRISFTRALWTDPIGFGGKKFLNVLALASTSLSIIELQTAMKDIERQCGRTPEGKKRYKIGMDIDVLEYGGQKLHLSDWDRDYIKELMAELPSLTFK